MRRIIDPDLSSISYHLLVTLLNLVIDDSRNRIPDKNPKLGFLALSQN